MDKAVSKLVKCLETELEDYRDLDLRMCMSSSFQTHSIPLLHMLSRFAPETEICFLDTGFHFPETIIFRDQIVEELGLKLRILRSPIPKKLQLDSAGYFLFSSDPDRCCSINKTLPMQSLLKEYDVWISGLRRDQNAHRKNLNKEVQTADGTLKYHPILEWTSKDIWTYKNAYNLPNHPMEEKGYSSIGCEPCTRSDLEGRSGRWFGQKKTECGLHMKI